MMKKMNIIRSRIYDPYKDNDNNKNAPIVNVEKKLFICNNVTGSLDDFFACEGQRSVEFPDFLLSTSTRQR